MKHKYGYELDFQHLLLSKMLLLNLGFSDFSLVHLDNLYFKVTVSDLLNRLFSTEVRSNLKSL